MLFTTLLVLAQAAAPQPLTEEQVFAPGNEYYWQTPCVIAAPDPGNRIQRLAEGFLALSRLNARVVRCVQPEGTAVVNSKMSGGMFLLIYSAELEEDGFPHDAVRGLVAHEVAHQRVEESCDGPFYRAYTEAQYLDCEARVDREAAVLVGAGAVKAALVQFHRLLVRNASARLERARRHLITERLRRLDAVDAKKASP